MTRREKKPKQAGLLRKVVALNVQALIQFHFGPDDRNAYRKIADKVGCSASTVERISKGQVGTSIDTLEALANYFGLAAYQMLLPRLDAHNPQIVREAMAEEKAFYKALLKAKSTG